MELDWEGGGDVALVELVADGTVVLGLDGPWDPGPRDDVVVDPGPVEAALTGLPANAVRLGAEVAEPTAAATAKATRSSRLTQGKIGLDEERVRCICAPRRFSHADASPKRALSREDSWVHLALGSSHMSVAVQIGELAEKIDEFPGPAYLVTVNADGSPHVVSVTASWDEGQRLVVPAGSRTRDNARRSATVTLLWPAAPGGDYALIVDGATASADPSDAALVIAPLTAVLHRTPEGDPSSPSCIKLLDRS